MKNVSESDPRSEGGCFVWSAICVIWLGKSTLPVLAVAKEVAALQRWRWPRSGRTAAEDRSTTNCGESFCLVIWLSFVWMFFFPFPSNNKARAPY